MIRFTSFLPRLGSGPSLSPLSQSSNRRALRLIAAVAVTATLLVVTGCQQAEPDESSPGDAAMAYLEAIADGDAGAANALSKPGTDDYPLPADDSLGGTAGTITDFSVGEFEPDEILTNIPVSYSLGDEKLETEISMSLVDGEWLVGSGLEGHAAIAWTGYHDGIIWWSDLAEVTIGTIAVGKYGAVGVLYPAVYDITSDLGPYGSLTTTALSFVPEDNGYTGDKMEIEVAATDRVISEAGDALVNDLDKTLARADDKWPDIFYGDDGPGAWKYVEDSLEGASVEWSVSVPVRVSPLQPGAGVAFDATATLNGSWSRGSKSGVITIPLETTVLAHPKGTLDALDVFQALWYIAD